VLPLGLALAIVVPLARLASGMAAANLLSENLTIYRLNLSSYIRC
jgi:hypothetical protein